MRARYLLDWESETAESTAIATEGKDTSWLVRYKRRSEAERNWALGSAVMREIWKPAQPVFDTYAVHPGRDRLYIFPRLKQQCQIFQLLPKPKILKTLKMPVSVHKVTFSGGLMLVTTMGQTLVQVDPDTMQVRREFKSQGHAQLSCPSSDGKTLACLSTVDITNYELEGDFAEQKTVQFLSVFDVETSNLLSSTQLGGGDSSSHDMACDWQSSSVYLVNHDRPGTVRHYKLLHRDESAVKVADLEIFDGNQHNVDGLELCLGNRFLLVQACHYTSSGVYRVMRSYALPSIKFCSEIRLPPPVGMTSLSGHKILVTVQDERQKEPSHLLHVSDNGTLTKVGTVNLRIPVNASLQAFPLYGLMNKSYHDLQLWDFTPQDPENAAKQSV